MLAKPPWWLAWPPCLAMLETSSVGRLAKLPGLVLPVEDMLVLIKDLVFGSWEGLFM